MGFVTFVTDRWKWAVAAAIGLLAVSVLIAGYLAWSGGKETDSATLLRKAVSQLEGGLEAAKQEEGIRLLQEVTHRYAKSAAAAEATLRLGMHYYTLGSYDEARKAYTAYLEKNPKGQIAFSAGLGLGDTYLAERNYEKAVEIYTRLVEQFHQEPLLPEAQLHLAAAYHGMNRVTEARALHEKIVATYPNTGWAQRSQAELYKSGPTSR
ncbi:Tetratricopeptide TPR_2 [Candidatus Methylomirabilis lanthanidiphila]|uniref:Tetratricopeptide TPR_2 n=1 Tax=Candidatus Methylomirabilis lanthanidiphila TaxID=2211376 RepID=A0A564ZFA2_9BACT|nr:tetratricopeptide repeat protein [Candidatus Methylomirabilis lanthanidiphila]VUZ83964.1 Tetratricopeptide TPR_2 [Candidatus Methylomirabilis lanthanidiphila]